MAGGKVVPAERARSHVSYYVVMAAILGLLLLLCCYACYFFISKIRELSDSELPTRTPPPRTTPATPCNHKEQAAQAGYPVQPVVRDTATAMAAALCRQLPAGLAPQGDQVFPGARSPAPRPAHASPSPPAPHSATGPAHAPQRKLHPEESCTGVEAPSIAVEAAR